jgi:hypothetical protein
VHRRAVTLGFDIALAGVDRELDADFRVLIQRAEHVIRD